METLNSNLQTFHHTVIHELDLNIKHLLTCKGFFLKEAGTCERSNNCSTHLDYKHDKHFKHEKVIIFKLTFDHIQG